MNIVRRLFARTPDAAHGLNHEGFPTYQRSLAERYMQTLLTNTIGSTFYASQGSNYALALELHQAMLAHNPLFAAKALVYAREQGTMRLQPIIGLVVLSTVDLGLFHLIFKRIILTPGDLQDFVQIVRSRQIRPGMGRAIKQTINDWLLNLSEYHVIKYGGTNAGSMTLRDVLRLTRPQPIDDRTNALFSYLIDRERWRTTWAEQASTLLPQIAAVEQLKRTSDPTEQRALVEAGRLPYEIVTGTGKPDLAMWRTLIEQMPYLALLRNLASLQRAGVFHDAAMIEYVVGRLGDLEALRRAKILPFRLHAAWLAFTPLSEQEKLIQQTLEQMIEMAFVNMPEIPGRVVVAPDVSGSMRGSINPKSQVRYVDVAGIFAGSLYRSNPTAQLLPFNTSIVQMETWRETKLMWLTKQITAKLGGGTAVSAPISYLYERREVVDVVIAITDNEEWARDSDSGTSFVSVWRKYLAKVNPKAQAFLITIAPYPHAVAPPDEPNVSFIFGWAEHVPAYIAQSLLGYADQLSTIEQITL
ncbi:TROVE domain-containing protein [Herpetosiphon sp.]|nr:TROVE domain-containing protein [Herpetosiphon sp.]